MDSRRAVSSSGGGGVIRCCEVVLDDAAARPCGDVVDESAALERGSADLRRAACCHDRACLRRRRERADGQRVRRARAYARCEPLSEIATASTPGTSTATTSDMSAAARHERSSLSPGDQRSADHGVRRDGCRSGSVLLLADASDWRGPDEYAAGDTWIRAGSESRCRAGVVAETEAAIASSRGPRRGAARKRAGTLRHRVDDAAAGVAVSNRRDQHDWQRTAEPERQAGRKSERRDRRRRS